MCLGISGFGQVKRLEFTRGEYLEIPKSRESRVRARRPDLPVLLVSGNPASAPVAELLGEPRTGFLAKPFEPDDLLDAVTALLAGAPAPA